MADKKISKYIDETSLKNWQGKINSHKFDNKLEKSAFSSKNTPKTKKIKNLDDVLNNPDLNNDGYSNLENEFYNSAINAQAAGFNINGLNSDKEQKEAEITNQQSIINDLKGQIDSAQPQIATCESNVSAKANEEPQQSSYMKTETDKDGKTKQVPDTKTFNSVHRQWEIELNNAKEELKQAKDKLEELKQQLSQEEDKLNTLQNELSQINDEITEAENQQQKIIPNNSEITATEQIFQPDNDYSVDEEDEIQTESVFDESTRSSICSVLGLDKNCTDEEIAEKINEIVDESAQNQLTELAAKYTDRTDLTQEDYQHIIALEQITQNFENLYGQYKNELDTEGWIDNVYNALKDISGLGITREMVAEEFEKYSYSVNMLTKMINNDNESAQEDIYNIFQTKLDDEPENTDSILKAYCGNEENALSAINQWLEENIEELRLQSIYGENADFKARIVDDEFVITTYMNGEEFYDVPLSVIADNPQNIYYNALKDNQALKDLAPADFESSWKVFTGVDFNYDNLSAYIDASNLSSQAVFGMSNAMDTEKQLKNKTPDEAFEVFKNKYNNDEDSAIEAFNNYYSSLLSEYGCSNLTVETLNNTVESITARKNEKGETEIVMKFIPSDPQENYSLDSFINHEEDSPFYEFVYNVAEEYEYKSVNDMTDEEYMQQFAYGQDKYIADDIFWQINNAVAQKQLLQKRFEKSFEENNGISVEEANSKYQNAAKEFMGESTLNKKLSAYINDMDSYSKKVSMAMSLGGIGLSFICPGFGVMAMAGVFADNFIDGINMATNNKKGEDWQSLVQETLKEGAYMAIGMGINATAQSAHSLLSTKLVQSAGKSLRYAETAGTMLEVGIDGALSIGFDYAATGNINLSGNSLGLLIDVVSGIRGYKAIQSRLAANTDLDLPTLGAGPKKGSDEYIFQKNTLTEAGLSESAALKLIEAGKFSQADTLLKMQIDAGQIKDIANLSKEQFTKCLSLVDKGISPYSAKQLVKLDDASIANALKLKEAGVPDLVLADAAALKDIPAERLMQMLNDPDISNYYITQLAILKNTDYDNAITLIKQGGYNAPTAISAVQKQGFDLTSALENTPNMKQEITPEVEQILREQLGILYPEYTSHIEETSSITKKLFKKFVDDDQYLTSREKSPDSALKKLISKYESRELDVSSKIPSEITDACRIALKDAYGTRIQLPSIDKNTAKQLVEQYGYDYNDFCKNISDVISNGDYSQLDFRYRDIIDELKVKQTQPVVDKMVAQIKNGKFNITELENYGDELSSYFTKGQLQQIADAYYKANNTPLTIVTKLSYYDATGKYVEIDKIEDISALYKNKGAVKDSGYSSSQMNVTYKFKDNTDGYGEFQVRGKEVNAFSEVEHVPYDIEKGKITPKDTQYSEIYSLIKNMDDNSYVKYNYYLTQVYEALRVRELGIDMEIPKIGTGFIFNDGTEIPAELLQKLSYEGLIKYH